MAFDSRLVGSWGTGAVVDRKIAEDQASGDGFWYRVGGKSPYLLLDSNTLQHWKFQDGTAFIYNRVGSSSANSIIGYWRHTAVPAQNGDEGEVLSIAADGTYRSHFDSETKDYFGTYVLSQDASGLFISYTEYLLRLQTSGSAFSATTIDGDLHAGTFAFSADSNTVTFTYTSPPGSLLTLRRF